jgi:hypothetical protein
VPNIVIPLPEVGLPVEKSQSSRDGIGFLLVKGGMGGNRFNAVLSVHSVIVPSRVPPEPQCQWFDDDYGST